MIIWAEGTVTAITGRWAGAVEVRVRRDDAETDEVNIRALGYTALMAEPAVGDRALLNVAALERGLGTGGYALIIAVLDTHRHLTGQPAAPRGHLVKARYLPQQVMVGGADEQGSEFHQLLSEADSITGVPVVVADLHSAVPAVLAAIQHDRPGTRVVYVMSDHGALPLAFSRTVAELRDRELLAATVTAGQAFGGDLEAVNVHSGLLAARLALKAEIVIVSQGPGNLGTGTRWGFSGVSCGEVINAAGLLGGRPVGTLRISGADQRARHRGLSHHSLTAYGRVALATADIAVPKLDQATALSRLGGLEHIAALAPGVAASLADLDRLSEGRHRLVEIDLSGLDQALTDSPIRLSTMGRGLNQDPAYFLAAAAAGRHAAALLGRTTGERDRPKA